MADCDGDEGDEPHAGDGDRPDDATSDANNPDNHLLEPFPVLPTDPYPFLDAIEEAIAGTRTLLPIPADDLDRTKLLTEQLRAGTEIDPEVALVVATSGSTGIPKGAQLTAVNLVASADATHQFLGGAGAWLLALPAHHIAGIQVLVRSLVAGIDPTFVDLSAGFQVAEFADAAEELRADAARCYTALTPMQLLKGMDTLQGIEALRLFDAILVGGGPLLDDDRRAARELGIRVVTTYGSAETTGGCVYNGLPLPGVTIRLENERIMVGGPMVAQGYRNFPDHEAFSRPGFYRTSDTGLLRNGVLRVTGRIDTIIDSGGVKKSTRRCWSRYSLTLLGWMMCAWWGFPTSGWGKPSWPHTRVPPTWRTLLRRFRTIHGGRFPNIFSEWPNCRAQVWGKSTATK